MTAFRMANPDSQLEPPDSPEFPEECPRCKDDLTDQIGECEACGLGQAAYRIAPVFDGRLCRRVPTRVTYCMDPSCRGRIEPRQNKTSAAGCIGCGRAWDDEELGEAWAERERSDAEDALASRHDH